MLSLTPPQSQPAEFRHCCDVWGVILQHLDDRPLLEICGVNRSFNQLAQPILRASLLEKNKHILDSDFIASQPEYREVINRMNVRELIALFRILPKIRRSELITFCLPFPTYSTWSNKLLYFSGDDERALPTANLSMRSRAPDDVIKVLLDPDPTKRKSILTLSSIKQFVFPWLPRRKCAEEGFYAFIILLPGFIQMTVCVLALYPYDKKKLSNDVSQNLFFLGLGAFMISAIMAALFWFFGCTEQPPLSAWRVQTFKIEACKNGTTPYCILGRWKEDVVLKQSNTEPEKKDLLLAHFFRVSGKDVPCDNLSSDNLPLYRPHKPY